MNISPLEPYQRRVTIVDVLQDDKVVEVIIDTRIPWSGFVPVQSVVPNPDQPRKHFDENELELLAGSLKTTMQVAPITAVLHEVPEDPDILWMINDGERRLRSLKKIGGRHFIWIAYHPSITIENIFKMSAISNLCRKGHTYMENAHAISVLMDCEDMSFEHVAEQMGFTISWVKQLNSLLRLHPTIQAALDPPTPKAKRIPIIAAVALATVDQDSQLAIWEEVRKLPKTRQSLQVRLLVGNTPSVTGARKRRRSDNGRIAIGKFNSILRIMSEGLEMPREVFESIHPRRRIELHKMVAEAKDLLQQLELRTKRLCPTDVLPSVGLQEKPLEKDGEVSPQDQPQVEIQEEGSDPAEQIHKPQRIPVPSVSPKRVKRVKSDATVPRVGPRRNWTVPPPPPAPHEIRRPHVDELPEGTPAELPKPEPQEDPEVVLQRIREENKQKAVKEPPPVFKPVFKETPPALHRLTAEEILRNMDKERQEAAKRHRGHGSNATSRNSLTGLEEGTGFTDKDFRDDGDLRHGLD